MAGLYADLDVRRNRSRRVDARSVIILYDFGPQAPKVIGAPSQADARRTHTYEKARAIWMKESGGKPIDVGFNGADAAEIRLRDPARWRTSPTATVEENIAEPKSTGQVVVDLVSASGGGAQFGGYWLQDITTGAKYVVFSPDYIEWQSRDARYQPTTPSAH